MESTEIKLVQKPIIQHALVELGKSIKQRIDDLHIDEMAVNDETIQSIKKLRTNLNNEKKQVDENFKNAIAPVTTVIDEIKGVKKSNVDQIYSDADNTFKDKITAFELIAKTEKKKNVLRYFNELCESLKIDFLKFESLGIEINLSTSEKQYQGKVNEFVQRVSDDVLLINVQEFEAEIMVEYRKTLNASKAITTVTERKAAEKLQAERIKQVETQRRQTLLRSLSMTFSDLSKSFHWIHDENVSIKNSDIENLTKEDFQKRFVELELLTKIPVAPVAAPTLEQVVNSVAPQLGLFSSMTNGTPAAPVEKTVPPPLTAPVEVAPAVAPEIFTAQFEATGTLAQLKSIGEFMKQNLITYKNL